jgi:hypothetical protein
MICEVFLTEMYSQRPGGDMPSQEFADHLRSCASCSQKFAHMIQKDVAIRHTIQSMEPPAALESTILSGLAMDRKGFKSERHRHSNGWWRWLLVPVAATLVFAIFMVHARWQSHAVLEQAANLLHSAPALQFEDGDRKQILRWASQMEPGTATLPERLARVQFRGASALRINRRTAVLLRMKHEPRASLLIVDQPLPGAGQIASRSVNAGSLAYWTEQKKTYVLLFDGSLPELQTYMRAMGIST